MVGRVRQVVKQTRIRIFAGDTKLPGKIMSVFKPHTEIIRNAAQQKIPRTRGDCRGGRGVAEVSAGIPRGPLAWSSPGSPA
jgi:hypothetical protein